MKYELYLKKLFNFYEQELPYADLILHMLPPIHMLSLVLNLNNFTATISAYFYKLYKLYELFPSFTQALNDNQ